MANKDGEIETNTSKGIANLRREIEQLQRVSKVIEDVNKQLKESYKSKDGVEALVKKYKDLGAEINQTSTLTESNMVMSTDMNNPWLDTKSSLSGAVSDTKNLLLGSFSDAKSSLSGSFSNAKSLLSDSFSDAKSLLSGSVSDAKTLIGAIAEVKPIYKINPGGEEGPGINMDSSMGNLYDKIASSNLGEVLNRENEQLKIKAELYDEVVKAMSAAMGGSNELKRTTGDNIKTFLEMGSSAADLITVLQAFGSNTTTTASTVGGLGTVLSRVGGGLAKFAGPIGLAASALGVVYSAIDSVWKKMKETDLKKRFGDVSLSMDQINDAAYRIVVTDNMSKLAKALDVFKNLKNIKAELDSLKEKIESLHYKVSIGIELTLEEKESYAKSVNDGLDKMQDYLLTTGSGLNLTLPLLYGEIQPEDGEFLKTINSIIISTSGAIDVIRGEFAQSLENGIDGIDIMKAAEKYYIKMKEFDSAIVNAKTASDLQMLMLEFNNGVGLSEEDQKEFDRRVNELATKSSDSVKEAIGRELESLYFAYEIADEGQKPIIQAQIEGYLSDIGSGRFDDLIKEPFQNALRYYLDTVKQKFPETQPLFDKENPVPPSNLSFSLSDQTKSNGRDMMEPVDDMIKLIEGLGYACETATSEVGDSAENIKELGEEGTTTRSEFEYLKDEAQKLKASFAVITPDTIFKYRIPDEYATGTPHTSNTFIAGEKGAELITNMPGMTVYNAMETGRILKSFRGLNASAMVGQPNAMRTSSKALPDFKLAPLGENTYKIDSNLNITVNGDIPGDLEQQLARHENRIIARVREEIRSDERNKGRRSLA